jgi:hypothetical protein
MVFFGSLDQNFYAVKTSANAKPPAWPMFRRNPQRTGAK